MLSHRSSSTVELVGRTRVKKKKSQKAQVLSHELGSWEEPGRTMWGSSAGSSNSAVRVKKNKKMHDIVGDAKKVHDVRT